MFRMCCLLAYSLIHKVPEKCLWRKKKGSHCYPFFATEVRLKRIADGCREHSRPEFNVGMALDTERIGRDLRLDSRCCQ
jgi:hypothetical protein